MSLAAELAEARENQNATDEGEGGGFRHAALRFIRVGRMNRVLTGSGQRVGGDRVGRRNVDLERTENRRGEGPGTQVALETGGTGVAGGTGGEHAERTPRRGSRERQPVGVVGAIRIGKRSEEVEANADERETLGFISITSILPSAGFTAN